MLRKHTQALAWSPQPTWWVGGTRFHRDRLHSQQMPRRVRHGESLMGLDQLSEEDLPRDMRNFPRRGAILTFFQTGPTCREGRAGRETWHLGDCSRESFGHGDWLQCLHLVLCPVICMPTTFTSLLLLPPFYLWLSNSRIIWPSIGQKYEICILRSECCHLLVYEDGTVMCAW